MTRSAVVAAVVVAIAAVGCGSKGGTAVETGGRVERCADRLLQRTPDPLNEEARRYAIRTYCGPFDARRWVYDDGVLNIKAYHQLGAGGSSSCATMKPGEPAQTVPCEKLEMGGPLVLDCALLHVVQRSEVATYIEELQREKAPREVKCDDGTALNELGTD